MIIVRWEPFIYLFTGLYTAPGIHEGAKVQETLRLCLLVRVYKYYGSSENSFNFLGLASAIAFLPGRLLLLLRQESAHAPAKCR